MPLQKRQIISYRVKQPTYSLVQNTSPFCWLKDVKSYESIAFREIIHIRATKRHMPYAVTCSTERAALVLALALVLTTKFLAHMGSLCIICHSAQCKRAPP